MVKIGVVPNFDFFAEHPTRMSIYFARTTLRFLFFASVNGGSEPSSCSEEIVVSYSGDVNIQHGLVGNYKKVLIHINSRAVT